MSKKKKKKEQGVLPYSSVRLPHPQEALQREKESLYKELLYYIVKKGKEGSIAGYIPSEQKHLCKLL